MFSIVYRDIIAVASVFDVIPVGWDIVDCRAMIDGPGNARQLVDDIVADAIRRISGGDRLCIACDYGQSRSNVVAALVIGRLEGRTFAEGLDRVRAAHQDSAVKPNLLREFTTTTGRDTRRVFAVTGASGLIGAPLTARLVAEGQAVIALSRSTHGDYLGLTNTLSDLIHSTRISDIIHLAHPKPYNSYAAAAQSIGNLMTLLDACTATGCRLHFVSSWVVFDGSDAARVTEGSPPLAHSLYAQSKLTEETFVGMHSRNNGLDSIIYRLPGIYARRSLEPRFLRYFADCVRRGDDLRFHSFNNGSAVVPLSSLEAMIPFFASTLLEDHFPGSIVHLADTALNISVERIATLIATKHGMRAVATPVDRKAFTGAFAQDRVPTRPTMRPRERPDPSELVAFVDSLIE